MPLLPAYAEYRRHIEEGSESGLIRFTRSGQDAWSVADDFSPLPDKVNSVHLCEANTRPLIGPARQLVQWVLKNGDGRLRFLELGHGAGVACCEAYQMAEEAGVEPHIQAVGLTPVSPFVGLLKPSPWFTATAQRLNESPKVLDIQERLLRYDPCTTSTRKGGDGVRFPLDLALELEKRFQLGFFRFFDQPYIEQQHIGGFEDQIELEPGIYDVIYERNGVAQYSHPSDRQALLNKILRLRSAHGIIIFTRHAVRGGITLLGESKCPLDVGPNLVIESERNDTIVMTDKNSPFALSLQPALEGKRKRNGIVLVDDFDDLLAA